VLATARSLSFKLAHIDIEEGRIDQAQAMCRQSSQNGWSSLSFLSGDDIRSMVADETDFEATGLPLHRTSAKRLSSDPRKGIRRQIARSYNISQATVSLNCYVHPQSADSDDAAIARIGSC